jgi:signal transduction histidine kinase
MNANAEGLVVQADPMLLDRVVENLLANAAKHTPPGTRVILSVRARGGDAVVSITDDGPGIPANELKRVGDRFYRGMNTATFRIRGLGLGLALVSEILDIHGSRLEVESEVGRGSLFRFRLPIAHRSTATNRPAARPA